MAKAKSKKSSEPAEVKKHETNMVKKSDDNELEKRAVNEIFREIAIKSVRAEIMGPSGWLDCPLKKTNKRFLGNTMKSVISHNERKKDQNKFKSEKKLLELDYEKFPSKRPKFGERKILFKKPIMKETKS